MMGTLKPCPFCGDKAVLKEDLRWHGAFRVECSNCDATVWATGENNPASAIAYWNQRAGPTPRGGGDPDMTESDSSAPKTRSEDTSESAFQLALGKLASANDFDRAAWDKVLRLYRAATTAPHPAVVDETELNALIERLLWNWQWDDADVRGEALARRMRQLFRAAQGATPNHDPPDTSGEEHAPPDDIPQNEITTVQAKLLGTATLRGHADGTTIHAEFGDELPTIESGQSRRVWLVGIDPEIV